MKRWLGPAVGLLLAGLAAWALQRFCAGLSWGQVVAALGRLGLPHLLVLGLLPVVSILLLAALDRRHARHLGHGLPGATALVGVACAQGVSLNIGNSLVMGGAVRLRIYGALGLPLGHGAILAALNFLAVNLGVAALAGTAWLLAPPQPQAVGRALAAVGIAAGLGWVVLALVHDPLIGRTPFLTRLVGRMPSPRLACLGLATGLVEKAIVTSGLLVLLPSPSALGATPAEVVAAFLAAVVVGKWSQVPGGLGVIEAAFIGLLPTAPTGDLLAQVVAAFIAFRLAYYLLPLLMAGSLLLAGEARAWRWLPRITP